LLPSFHPLGEKPECRRVGKQKVRFALCHPLKNGMDKIWTPVFVYSLFESTCLRTLHGWSVCFFGSIYLYDPDQAVKSGKPAGNGETTTKESQSEEKSNFPRGGPSSFSRWFGELVEFGA
jgi:hypothetical protein